MDMWEDAMCCMFAFSVQISWQTPWLITVWACCDSPSGWVFKKFKLHLADLETWMPYRCHSLVQKVLFKKLMKHFKGFSTRFTKIHAKLDADALLACTIHHRQKQTYRKMTLVETTWLHCGARWQADAIGLQKCDFGLPSFLLSRRQVTMIKVRELSDRTH
jgi:hypothetical protein